MKKAFVSALIIALNFIFHTKALAQDVFCEACSREAWLGDSAALNKFIASCGVIDTVSYDSLNNPVKEKPVYQTITMKLNSGKVMFNDKVYFVTDNMPEFPGGQAALMKHLSANIRYPATAAKEGISGTVYVKCIIEKDGLVKNTSIVRGIGGGCDEEAKRLIKTMPKWKQGTSKGKPVRVQMNIPVRFAMQ